MMLTPTQEELYELLDEQFERGWDAAVRAAFEIIEQEVEGLGHKRMMARIHMRFRDELDMKEG